MDQPKILLVEDDADVIQAMAIRLRSAGYEVISACDAYQAVQMERAHRPAVVILDIKMPAGDGFMVHENLRKFSDFCAPVIYITGKSGPNDEQHARELGAKAYLKKPIDSTYLLEIIEKVTAKKHEV